MTKTIFIVILALDAGINVFSLANNHTNDQKIDGILQTFLWAETNENSNKIYFSGIKNIPNSEITYKIIEYNSWKIIFCAITEILNQNIGKEYINFVNYTEQGRNDFIKTVNNIRHSNESDIFILSIHSNETEYVKDVKQGEGKIVEILGKKGERGVEIDSIIRAHGLPEEFPKKVIDEANFVAGQE